MKPPYQSEIRLRRDHGDTGGERRDHFIGPWSPPKEGAPFEEPTYFLGSPFRAESTFRTRLEAYNAAMILWEELRAPVEVRARSGAREWVEAKVDELGGFHQL